MSIYCSINTNIDDGKKNINSDDNYGPFQNAKDFVQKENDLLKERKVQLVKDLKDIQDKIYKEDNIDAFIYNNVDDILGVSQVIILTSNICSFINIKLIGTVFITLYFIGVLEIIGLLNTIREEIKASFNITLLDKKRKTDFYQNYINENLKMPSFNLFFLSALFSDFLINLITFPGTVILILLINSSIIYFGLGSFDFHSGESLNERYTFKENMYLIGLYLVIYLFLGIIALFRYDIIQKGFILFDLQVNENDKIKKNGYVFVFLLSMVVSSVIKIVLDRKFVFHKVRLIINNENDQSFFDFSLVIIIIYGLSMIISLIFYAIYEFSFDKKKEKKSNTSHEASKICGYLIYKEKTSGDCCNNFCLDCSAANYKCGMCLGLHLCNCCCCCLCCPSDYNEAEEGAQQICVIYKLKGCHSWIFDLLAGLDMFKLVVAIYIFELINLGFNPELSRYINDNIGQKEILIINIISFSSIILLYLINIIVGYLFFETCSLGKKAIELTEDSFSTTLEKTELNLIIQPIIIFVDIIVGLSTIISILFYYKALKEVIYYIIPFSLSISEYANIIFVYYTGNNITVDIVKKSVAISFYKMIFSIFLSFINIFDLKNESLIFTQFIMGCIISGILSFYLIYTAIAQVQKE